MNPVWSAVDSSAVWQHQTFVDLFAEPLLAEGEGERAPKAGGSSEALGASVGFVYNMLSQVCFPTPACQ